ncbi:hypothetical protein IQ16_03641 [Bradyrhizobium huanghuaihaiense]|uniref:Uncharacterized protein n=1 Tax=Bradyrhizobium huanghuaihaiense TaxID=990078 RepID=A0A562RN20_9BRAD|nr:hypothetical protein IQ16_03641 [Bradyrhizobium huanghuaihaiense]
MAKVSSFSRGFDLWRRSAWRVYQEAFGRGRFDGAAGVGLDQAEMSRDGEAPATVQLRAAALLGDAPTPVQALDQSLGENVKIRWARGQALGPLGPVPFARRKNRHVALEVRHEGRRLACRRLCSFSKWAATFRASPSLILGAALFAGFARAVRAALRSRRIPERREDRVARRSVGSIWRPAASHPEEADRAQGHLGGAEAARRSRISGQVAEGKVRHPFFKGLREDL